MAGQGPPPADLSPDTQEARGPILGPLCSPAGLRARAPPPPASRCGGSGRRPQPGPEAPQVPSIRPAPNEGPLCLVSPGWTTRGAGRRRCAQPGAGAGECLGRGRVEPEPGGVEKVEAGAPGRAVLEPELRAGRRAGGVCSARPAFGDDAAVQPSGRGAHAAPWSWVPQWRLVSPALCPSPNRRAVSVLSIVLGEVRIARALAPPWGIDPGSRPRFAALVGSGGSAGLRGGRRLELGSGAS